MTYICSKQTKIDRLWGVFIKHILQMEAAGLSVEYVRKGEVILNGWRYEPIGDHKEGNVLLVGHDIQPLIDYLKKVDLSRERRRQCT
jgi:hypothetical protein